MIDEASQIAFPDHAVQQTVRIERNEHVARDTYLLRFECPPIAERILPGQFIMLRLAHYDDPLLGRALALYDVVRDGQGRAIGLDVMYVTMGKLTRRLADLQPQQELEVWGPLGNGFAVEPSEHLVMVAGGIGQTPFLAMAKEHLGRETYGDPPRTPGSSPRVTLCYGARSAGHLAGVDDFQQLGVDVRISTDDGSAGHHGFVTALLADLLETERQGVKVYCCGPEPMMAAVAALAAQHEVPCRVSLESPMACGLGICFSCVARVRDADGTWDYRRTCVEGPVFSAHQIEF